MSDRSKRDERAEFFGHGIALLSTEARLSLLRKDKPSAGREMWPGLPMALPLRKDFLRPGEDVA